MGYGLVGRCSGSILVSPESALLWYDRGKRHSLPGERPLSTAAGPTPGIGVGTTMGGTTRNGMDDHSHEFDATGLAIAAYAYRLATGTWCRNPSGNGLTMITND